VNTFDLDIVHSRATVNLNRLHEALQSLDAHFREHKDRKIRPRLSNLDTAGHLLLLTAEGALDLLGTIGADLGYDKLLKHSVRMEVAKGLKVRVLNLDKYIEIKEELARDKDKAMLAVLRHTLKEKQKYENRKGHAAP